MGDYGINALDRAAYDAVHGYVHPATRKRGPLALGPILGMSGSTLNNKVDPAQEYARLSLHEALALMLATGDHGILYALARELGEACVPLPELPFPADSDLLAAWADWQAEVGSTGQSVRDALADGRIVRAEIELVRASLIRDFERGLAMLDVLRGMAEPEPVDVAVAAQKKARGRK